MFNQEVENYVESHRTPHKPSTHDKLGDYEVIRASNGSISRKNDKNNLLKVDHSSHQNQ